MAGMGWLIVFLSLACICTAHGQIGCRNADGASVDWWTALKSPKGGKYAYIDSMQKTPKFVYSEDSDLASTSNNPLAETVLQIYQEGVGYVLWNDQPLSKNPKIKVPEESLHAHAKGVLGFQNDGGFYLLHSTPNFPDDPAFKKGQYQGINDCTAPKKGEPKCGPTDGQVKFGQSYLCVSLNSTNLDAVAKVLRSDGLVLFASNIAGNADTLPNVAALIDQDAEGLPTKVYGDPITSVGGEQFKLFGMSPTEEDDPVFLYEQIVEPTLKAGMKLQTWTQGGRFPTYCPGGTQPDPEKYNFTVDLSTINVEYIKIDGTPLGWNCAGQGQKDHGKWGVTLPSESSDDVDDGTQTMRRLQMSPDATLTKKKKEDGVKVLCISDINRAGSQAFRGGGAMCFMNNEPLWEAFNAVITEEEACGTGKDEGDDDDDDDELKN